MSSMSYNEELRMIEDELFYHPYPAVVADLLHRRRLELLNVIKGRNSEPEIESCESCYFSNVDGWNEPCCRCRNNCKNYWRPRAWGK